MIAAGVESEQNRCSNCRSRSWDTAATIQALPSWKPAVQAVRRIGLHADPRKRSTSRQLESNASSQLGVKYFVSSIRIEILWLIFDK